MLTTQHVFDGLAAKVGADFLDSLGDVKVLDGRLDQPHSELSSIVSGLDDVGLLAIDGGRSIGTDNDGFGVDRGVTVDLDTEHDLDDIAILQDGYVLVRGQGGEVGDGVVDRDRGGESETCKEIRLSSERVSVETKGASVPLESPFLLFHTPATASETNLSPLHRRKV